MGLSFRHKSSHLANIKGKSILYEDDDELIKLTDQDDLKIIDEFRLSLIGKILNPKKQNVEKLIQKMPLHWGLADRIVANDLGNGKFLLNFSSEDDLNSVLRQGLFHFNLCMFVLVRCEPIVHDDYPWIIPFWVQLIGIPLHLWTDKNLRTIRSRLGYVDKVEFSEGRMLINVDTRRPLKFTRKAESDGDEVTIEIKYDMLFKHCSTCGMLTHEKESCPSLEIKNRLQPNTVRQDVFTRVQVPLEQSHHRTSSQSVIASRQPLLTPTDLNNRSFRLSSESSDRKLDMDSRYRGSRTDYGSYTDRIMRRQNDYSRSSRYGGSRASTGPYDRNRGSTWRAKSTTIHHGASLTKASEKAREEPINSNREVVSYGQPSPSRSTDRQNQEDERASEKRGIRRLASTIVTPSRDLAMEENITKRSKDLTRSLSFSTLRESGDAYCG